MKHILRLKKPFISLAVPFLFALLLSGCQSSRDQKRVLVFTRALKSVHASLPAGIDAITRLCLENGIAVDTTTNGGYFHEDSLPAYSAVIFLNTSADVLDYRQQADFERYIQSGGGFVGIHCAAATEYEWPWYNGLVGAWFDGHPDLQTATIHTTDVGHPSTDHLMKDWVRYDEWYNFRNIREGLQVVLTLDETTYEGGNHPGNHPIAWFHEYDGGRSFYTALGHTTESYTEEAFLTHVLGGIQYAIGDNRVSDYRQAKSQRVPADENFVKVVLDEKLDEPMELTVLPDGRILFVERRGDVHMYLPDERRTMLSIHLTVHDDYEEGLLGIAHDPAFADNQWIYLYYSPKGGASVQRLSRFTLSGNQVLADSEKVMLEIPAQREECCHSAGSIAFGPDGLLYLSLGDNTNPLTYTHYDRSYLFVPHDERPGRKNWDSQRTSGNTNDLRGGIIRIRPEADGTYTIPAGNLFPPGDSLSRPEIFVMGARNPFRISVDQHTGFVYFGEVGPDTGQDSERGPRGYDEFNQVRQAGNFGWPYHLGNNIPYYRYNHATGVLGEAFDPQNPENRSVNNTGRTLLPPAQPAMIWYPYEISEKFPSLGEGGRNAMAGPVYYAADYPPSSRKFPDYYSGKWFIYEWMRNWIKVVTFDEKNDFVKTEPFLPGLALSSPMDMEFGPDGALYLLEYGTNWFTGNDDARLVRIDYNDKNRLPIALATTQNSVGAVPLTVHFSADQSYDFDVADSLTFRWDLVSPTAKALGTGRQLDYTFEQPGEYRVELIVTDSKGESGKASLTVQAGNQPPDISIALAGNRTFYTPGRPLAYSVSVRDREDGSLADGGIAAGQVMFRIAYVEGAKAAEGHQINTNPHKKGMALIDNSDCKSCHSPDKQSVGPAYSEIARRYAGQQEALVTLADKVIQGGGGNWGEHAMAAHPQITPEEARQMVAYILSLTDGPGQSLPLTGQYPVDQTTGGLYVLEASYTDRGKSPIPPLTVTEKLILRPLQLEAEDCDAVYQMGKNRPSSTNYMRIVPLDNPAHVKFSAIDLSGLHQVEARVSSVRSGGLLELRSGSATGPLIGAIPVPNTGSDLVWVNVRADLTNLPAQVSDLYVVMTHPDSRIREGMFYLDWLRFSE